MSTYIPDLWIVASSGSATAIVWLRAGGFQLQFNLPLPITVYLWNATLIGGRVQIMINGLISGLMIAVLGLAFAFVYLPTRTFHFALGAIHAIVPYIIMECLHAGYGWTVSVVCGVAVAAGLSLACEILNHRHLNRKGAASSIHLVSSLGLYVVLSQAAALIWGNNPETLRRSADKALAFGALTLTESQLTEFIVGVSLLAAFASFIKSTSIGLQFRGMADNARETMLRGYNVPRLRMIAFALSGAFCAGSAIPLALDYGFDPNSGLATLMLAIVAVMIGGRGSFWGPAVGGILIGVLRSEVSWQLSANWQEAVTFSILGLVLLFRPSGIAGTTARLEAQE